MRHYIERAEELNGLGSDVLETVIQTRLSGDFRVTSVYKKEAEYDTSLWETSVWSDENKVVWGYRRFANAERVITLHSEIAKDYFETGRFFKEEELLQELKQNLCDEWLNESDSSVGIYPVGDLVHWANNDLKDAEGVTLLSVTKDNAIIECESLLFEIYGIVERTAPDETDFYWSIRLHDKKD